jgi:hypothetical protein
MMNRATLTTWGYRSLVIGLLATNLWVSMEAETQASGAAYHADNASTYAASAYEVATSVLEETERAAQTPPVFCLR